MKGTTKVFFLAGIVLVGVLAPAYAQTGDCYATAPGCLDPSFGASGRVTIPADLQINGIAVQQVGGESRIVAVGLINSVWTIVRYRADGTLDGTFGASGIVQTTFSEGNGTASGVAVQSDNKLVVVGSAPARKGGFFAIARYNENGSPDSSFGTGGMVLVQASKWSGLNVVAIQPDGKIVAAGGAYVYPSTFLAVIRLDLNGTLDTTFNGSGQYIYWTALSGASAMGFQTFDSGMRIVIAGSLNPPNEMRDYALFGFTNDGALDTSFGSGGVVATHLVDREDELYYGLAVDSSNRIFAVGASVGRMILVRYDSSGNLDSTFGSGGIVSPPLRLSSEGGGKVAIQSDGRILVLGEARDALGARYFAAWRFLPDGALDTTFGVNGWVTTLAAEAYYWVESLAFQPDGKFVAAGYTPYRDPMHSVLARYFGEVSQLAHDVAVYGISVTPSAATQGDLVTVQVTVGNNGTNTETADVAVTETPDGSNLGTQSVSLIPGETAMLTFTWLTTTATTGAHTLLATAVMTTSGVTDEQPTNNSRSTAVGVFPAGVNIVLTARPYKKNGVRMVDLTWTGASAALVDIYLNDGRLTTTENDGAWTHLIGGNNKVNYTYKVCDTGTTRCSNSATVNF